MTHQPQQILVRVETKDRLPEKAGKYSVQLTENGPIYDAILRSDNGKLNWLIVSVNHSRIKYWYEPATAIVLSVEEYEEMMRELFMLKNGLGNSDLINDNKPTDI